MKKKKLKTNEDYDSHNFVLQHIREKTGKFEASDAEITRATGRTMDELGISSETEFGRKLGERNPQLIKKMRDEIREDW